MAHSLADECTPLKHAYDSCFNAWFEGYLRPAVNLSPEQRAEYSKAKAEEYEQKCGKVWQEYQACVQVSKFTPALTFIKFIVHSFREQ